MTIWIVLSIPPEALLQEPLLVTLVIAAIGAIGIMTRNPPVVTTVFGTLLLLTVWGKIADDIYRLSGPDTALMLSQFMTLIFFMEATLATLRFESRYRPIQGRSDELVVRVREQMIDWEKNQLFNLGKLTLAAFGLSLGLLVVGGLVSVSFNHIAFSGALVLVVVVVLFVLLTYRREPETRRK
jgi:hypothetical protein